MIDYPWYDLIDGNSIEQGDFIPQCPIIIPPPALNTGLEIDVDVQLLNAIILSQSCDLLNDKLVIALVCPYTPLRTWVETLPQERHSSGKARKNEIENLRKGVTLGYHLLNKDESKGLNDYQVVDFKNVYGIQVAALRDVALSTKERLRLLSPYKEHLSQAFARYFMRVGLPQDIDIEGYW